MLYWITMYDKQTCRQFRQTSYFATREEPRNREIAEGNPMTTAEIVRDFKAGLSMVGLARKYGKTQAEIEKVIRKWMIRWDKIEEDLENDEWGL